MHLVLNTVSIHKLPHEAQVMVLLAHKICASRCCFVTGKGYIFVLYLSNVMYNRACMHHHAA